jgi:F0F1-type ATP synthase membrane subunit b/b'
MLDSRNFLVPDGTFIIEAVAFLAVLVVMTRWVLPRIRGAMEARQRAISQSLAAAREADERRRAAEAEAAEIRTVARREARRIKEQAWGWRDHLIAEAKRAGDEEYRWLAGRAGREQQRRTELMQRRFRMQARAAAIDAAQTYLGCEADRGRISALVDQHLDARAADGAVATGSSSAA